MFDNQLSSIEPGAFSGLANLTGLELGGNQLSSIESIDFSGLTNLKTLQLDGNVALPELNLDVTALDVLLDNLETIESTETEGILYMTQADYDAFNTTGGDLLAIWNDEPGHHVEFLQIGDVNHDTEVNGLDVDPFVDVLLASRFDVAADMNGDGAVNGLDVDGFVAAVVGGAQAVPEPSTLAICIITLGIMGVLLIPRRDVVR